ncbi:nuclease-related domain-containing protein [Alkalihalophilus pseudofirmus]|uniref:nuclease-related domain-containing protein n=1 Tax=Alkalihalophilus pseudofirmus TaxID=79885 RepID=UPI00259BB239|nr:nuclease-related domain-containing protein [Alkalihalophilus pseudofirmus]WEG16737.1 nuclease-related domain-containing protein [Alkalihalophilus pseudofirmus]
MIAKPRKIPVHIDKLEALLRRIPAHHPKKPHIEADLAKRKAGYKGESALDYHLSFLPPKEYIIFHDLRLQRGEYFFQIDTLILTPTYILIIEVKHLYGTLSFEPEFQQLIRTTPDAEDTFPDPIIQVQKQASQLRQFLKKHKVPDIPVETLVVITNSQSRISLSDSTSYTRKHVIRDTVLVKRIEKLSVQYQTLICEPKTVKKVVKLLIKSHTSSVFEPLLAYQLQRSDLIKGVHCLKCSALPMLRANGKWNCQHCWFRSNNAHINSLIDYSYLFEGNITNREAAEFLKINPSISKRLLTSLPIERKGVTKARRYQLDVTVLADFIKKQGIE